MTVLGPWWAQRWRTRQISSASPSLAIFVRGSSPRFLRLSGVYEGLVQGSRPRRRRLVAGEAVWHLRDAWHLATRFYAARGPIGLVVVSPDIRRTRVAGLVLNRLRGAVYESNLDQPCSHLSDASRRRAKRAGFVRGVIMAKRGRRVLDRSICPDKNARVGPTTRKRRKPRRKRRKKKSKRPTSRAATSSRASTRSSWPSSTSTTTT